MGRYHTLFYRIFAAAGILYFILLLILGILDVMFPPFDYILTVAAQLAGLVLFALLILLASAVIVFGVRKLCAVFRRDSGKTRDVSR